MTKYAKWDGVYDQICQMGWGISEEPPETSAWRDETGDVSQLYKWDPPENILYKIRGVVYRNQLSFK